jgi:polysaccharide export outer membrane protein
MLNLDRALHGKDLCPADEIWLSDSDVVLVPKGPILVCDDFINLVFTRGLYGVVPFTSNLSFAAVATL